jgi:Xaa-Pro dipeptidase
MPQIEAIQRELASQGLDGWLFYDFHHRDPIATHVLGLDSGGMGTRRWFYLIPARGTPRKLVHRIESRALDSLPGEKLMYAGLDELSRNLSRLLTRTKKVAMQYSPRNAIPYVSMVDAGTVEMVRAHGCKVLSSADLVQKFEACWSAEQYRTHLEAGRVIDRVAQEAFLYAARAVQAKSSAKSHAKSRANSATKSHAKSPLTEYDLQQWILAEFRTAGVVTDEPPIVAVGAHTGDPHYEPLPTGSSRIRTGDLLLLDIWGKLDRPGSVYYDITWVGYLGAKIPEKYAKIFAVVSEARDRVIAFVQKSISEGRVIQGWQVDRVAREVVRKAGYAKYFVHRTGHNIGQEVHGAGANMDSLETHDSRRILPQTCFSVEPGIYLSEFGVRSEVNVYVDGAEARVTGPVQTGILPLLA